MHSCSTTKVINLSRMKYLLLIGILCQLFFVVVPAMYMILGRKEHDVYFEEHHIEIPEGE